MKSIEKMRSIAVLSPPFREGIIWLEKQLEEKHIFMMRWETRRTPDRQEYLFKKGFTNAKRNQSAHQYGLACDYILDTSKIEVARRKWKSPQTGRTRWVPFAWDTDSPIAKETWLRFGFLVRQLGFVWGGDFGAKSDDDIGWDFPHVEMKNWRAYKDG